MAEPAGASRPDEGVRACRTELMEAALDSFREGLALLGEEGRVVFWNRAAEAITGFCRGEVVGRASLPGLDPLLGCRGNGSIAIPPPRRGVLMHGQCKNGEILALLVRALVLRSELGEQLGEVVIFRPMKKLDGIPSGEIAPDSSEEALLADLKDRVESVCERLRQIREPFGLLWITVDQARCLRKTHGAPACEAMLKRVERTLASSVRRAEEIGRWGEDGFLVVACEDDPQALGVRADLVRELAAIADFRWWGDRISLTVSVGAAFAGPDEALAEVLERAQTAMIASVEAGGNCVTSAPGRRP